MRFLHIADLHIGKRVNGMSLLDDQRFILNQIVTMVRERGVDALLVAGDIYDKAAPSAEAVTVFDGFLTSLADAGVRVLAVPGNHDSAERIAYAQGLLAQQGVCFPPVFAGTVERIMLEDAFGPVAVWLLPFLKPGDVRRFFPEEDIGDDYSAALGAALGACDVDASTRNVIVSHQLVTAAGKGPDRAEDEIKLGGIDNVDISRYASFDYVALGHVHRPQRIGRDTARYAGSPLKYSFSEARYDKSAVLVELGPKQPGDEVGACVSFELVPLVPLHEMREVSMTLDALLVEGVAAREAEAAAGVEGAAGGAEAVAVLADGMVHDAEDAATGCVNAEDGSASARAIRLKTDDYLHVTLTDEHPQLDAMRKIHEVFPNAMTLDYDNAAILAARDRVGSTVDPDEMSIVELFSQFYEDQVGRPLDDVQVSIVKAAARGVEESHARGSRGGKGGAR